MATLAQAARAWTDKLRGPEARMEAGVVVRTHGTTLVVRTGGKTLQVPAGTDEPLFPGRRVYTGGIKNTGGKRVALGADR